MRMLEMRQSLRIIEQCLNQMPAGDVRYRLGYFSMQRSQQMTFSPTLSTFCLSRNIGCIYKLSFQTNGQIKQSVEFASRKKRMG